ncbi:MAG TPA: isoprenylcysteine carboxylmethyltransferase family protein [Rhizomicrobium sp.]|jgi:protein-S-isoprenylcysteine O-methyltransferase Ste14
MMIYYVPIAALWLILIAFWFVSAIGVKRTVADSGRWKREILLRIALLAAAVLAWRILVLTHALRGLRPYLVNTSAVPGIAGVALCAVGVGIAIAARIQIGRNWGMPMARKENPELITTGPYAVIRHPIYTGFLLAMLGSALGESIVWLVPFAIAGLYFTASAFREEKTMAEQFPEQYAAYRARTKMLVPFVF